MAACEDCLNLKEYEDAPPHRYLKLKQADVQRGGTIERFVCSVCNTTTDRSYTSTASGWRWTVYA